MSNDSPLAHDERERVRIRRDAADQRFTDWVVWIVGVGAPLVNLLALDNRTWPYWLWLAVGGVVAAAYAAKRRY